MSANNGWWKWLAAGIAIAIGVAITVSMFFLAESGNQKSASPDEIMLGSDPATGNAAPQPQMAPPLDGAAGEVIVGEPRSAAPEIMPGGGDGYSSELPSPSNAPPLTNEEWGDMPRSGTGQGVIGYGRSSGIGGGSPAPRVNDSEIDTTEVDRKLASLQLGNIAFNTPQAIPLGDAATIELLVSLKEAEDELRAAVRAAGPVESARVKLSNKMEARLTGLGFQIEAITPEQQIISGTERTEWRWQIEPTKSDTLELHLTLSALITIDGQPSARAVRTFERTIEVEVPITQRVANTFYNHVELITSALLIPVVGGWYRQYRKKKRRQALANDASSTRRAA